MSIPTNAIYRHNLVIPPSAIDENGHLNNVEYVRWMQTVAIAHANQTNCTAATTAANATWIARSHKIEYLKPAFQDEYLILFTWIANIRKVRALRKYKFFRPQDQTIIATGETDWIFVNAQTGKPIKIPNTVTNAFEIISKEIGIETLNQIQ